MNYKFINTLTGFFVFLVSLVVYLLTVSPTVSFWDCGEFIACSNELEVTHPPGAPLFLLLGRLFSMMAGGNVMNIAYMVNLLSVLSAACTSMLTCWIATYFTRNALQEMEVDSTQKVIMSQVAGLVAGLSCTFADSLWWNAVEAEVYAMSSFFTALVVWLMCKWDERAHEVDHLKWIILIAYIMGLSIGVHLLNLLTIPALALVYYFRKYDFTWQGFFITLVLSLSIVLFVQYGIIQYTFSLAWLFEKVFTGTISKDGAQVGGWGLPMGTGFLVFASLIFVSIIALIIYSQKKNKIALNTIAICTFVILTGFSSYSLIFIRSGADPAIDMNNPENLLTFLSYMRREQYGDRPLVYGPMYNSGIVALEEGAMQYVLLDSVGRYVEDERRRSYVYEPGSNVVFPRMYDPSKYNAGPFAYDYWVKNKGEDPQNPMDDRPTYGENLSFFLGYQVNHMYLRYFMWNFVGRASDIQGESWESGLEPKAQRQYNAGNKAKNHYYFIPLLLGLLGLIWQANTKGKDAAIVAFLFFFTGLAIIIYLNQTPGQPRERDYSYAGSFQTFCIWIGMGALFLWEMLRRFHAVISMAIAGLVSVLGPLLMAYQNWDDHTRKGRYIDREFAYNLLNTCAPNAVLFTGGDNDTFPLWYIQEVEGVRTDVRIVNLELLVSDWYVDQMKESKNGALPVPITMNRNEYVGESAIFIPDYLPKTLRLLIQKDALVKQAFLSPEEAIWATDTMEWKVPTKGSSNNPYILRRDSVILNIVQNVAKENWQRPVYFAGLLSQSSFFGLEDFLRLEGLAYRVVPIKSSEKTPNDLYYGWVGQEQARQNLMEKYLYSELNNPKVYFDDHARGVVIQASYRMAFYRLCNTYADQIAAYDSLPEQSVLVNSHRQKVRELLTFMEEKIPGDIVQEEYNTLIFRMQLLHKAGLLDMEKETLAAIESRGLSELELAEATKRRPANLTLNAIYLTAQQKAELGDTPGAEALLQRLSEFVELE